MTYGGLQGRDLRHQGSLTDLQMGRPGVGEGHSRRRFSQEAKFGPRG